MIVFKKEQDLRKYLSQQRTLGKRVGFVPTMGALHAGHRSLIERSVQPETVTVCSIFVNPTQFNDKTDYDKYPATPDADLKLLLDARCDVAFMPDAAEMYPQGFEEVRTYDFGYLDNILEGAHRPGHFKGVGQIVSRLLEMVQPDMLFMGQKDYQQCMVVKKLLGMMGREQQIQLVVCDTVREDDGLAMSSRNVRLTAPQRALAASIYQCLVSIQSKQNSDHFSLVRKECLDLLKKKGLDAEYVSLADAADLTLLEDYEPSKKMVALIAASIGGVRLIDNLFLNP